jgi:flagellar basal body P-ring formation protein FlgA
MRLLSLGSGVLVLAALATQAAAATLRDTDVMLSDSSIRLSDLFNGIGNDRVIGPAPDPGQRIVVEAAQLTAIARQFGVDWRPVNTGSRVVMERPGQQFPRETALSALRTTLLATGIPVNSEIETPAFNPPMVPLGVTAQPDVTQASYDSTTGRFTALLSITADGMTPFNARLSGHVQEMVDVEVTTRRLAAGEVLGPDDVQPARVRAGLVRSEAARLPEQAVGLAARRPINAGAPVLLVELAKPLLMQRGSPVQVQLDMPGLSVTVQGVAMEPAALGDRVQVLNPTSRTVLDAEVTGASQVRMTGRGSAVALPPGMPIPQVLQPQLAAR